MGFEKRMTDMRNEITSIINSVSQDIEKSIEELELDIDTYKRLAGKVFIIKPTVEQLKNIHPKLADLENKIDDYVQAQIDEYKYCV